VHVSSVPKEHDYTTIVQEGLLSDQPGDTLSFGNGFDVVMDSLVALMEQPDFSAYQLKLRLHHKGETYRAGPGFVIQDNEFRALPDELEALGLRFQVKGVKPEDRQMVLQIDKANDFITIKAISKPYINFLWLGTFLLAGGFGIAIVRRIRENRGKRQS
jgi:cytochrome c-type biogenesis protein CcmF